MPTPFSILLIEPMARRHSVLYAALAAGDGHEVIHVESTRAAAECLHGVRFDALFIDFGLTKDSALQFIRCVRCGLYSDHHDLPIIGVGAAQPNLVVRARDAGVHGYLTRPISKAGVQLQLTRIRAEGRQFIRSRMYIGPDRRRWNDPNFSGPERRDAEDGALYIA